VKIGIAIDPWKLEIFKRHLDTAGVIYKVAIDDGLVTTITVEGWSPSKLQPIIEAAQRECAQGRAN
jgi:hypothetical protein